MTQVAQAPAGLGRVRRRAQHSEPATPVGPWVATLVRRMWRDGIGSSDAQVRALWNVLRQRGALQRGSWLRGFIGATWKSGLQARDPRMRQFAQELRSLQLLPQRATATTATAPPRWWSQPPWWYRQPPAWYGQRQPPVMPRWPARPVLRPMTPLTPVAFARR